MRWDDLFTDLESQLEQGQRAELEAEVADRIRREVGALTLVDRLRPLRGALLTFDCPGGVVEGVLHDVGPDWALVEEAGRRGCVVALAHVLSVVGAGRSSAAATEALQERWDLRHVLRGLVRDRATVQVVLADGRVLGGTLDRVGQDHVDLAEHDLDRARRAAAVRQVRLLPLTALAVVRRAG